jgi:hypothetical protein
LKIQIREGSSDPSYTTFSNQIPLECSSDCKTLELYPGLIENILVKPS